MIFVHVMCNSKSNLNTCVPWDLGAQLRVYQREGMIKIRKADQIKSNNIMYLLPTFQIFIACLKV